MKRALLTLFSLLLMLLPLHAAMEDSAEYAFDRAIPGVEVIGERPLPGKRNNPAMDIMRHAAAQKTYNRINRYADWSYRLYRRTLISIAERKGEHIFLFPDSIAELQPRPGFFDKYRVVPISLREEERVCAAQSRVKLPVKTIGRRINGLDETIDFGSLTDALNKMFGSVDPYEANIRLFDKEFPTPFHPLATTGYYRFLLADTVREADRVCYLIRFAPNNRFDPGLEGVLKLDTATLSLLSFDARIAQKSTLNYSENSRIEVHYAPDASLNPSLFLPVETRLTLLITALEGLPVHIEIEVVEKAHSYATGTAALSRERLNPVSALPAATQAQMGTLQTGNRFGIVERPIPLSEPSEQTIRLMQLLHRQKNYALAMQTGTLLTTGFLTFPFKTTQRSEQYGALGPVDALLSGNPIEGFRTKVGFMTLAKMHPHWFASGYLAYGFRDKRPKFMLHAGYSIPRRHAFPWEFPMKMFECTLYSDLFVPGNNTPPLLKDGIEYTLNNLSVRNRYYEEALRMSFQSDLSRAFSAGVAVTLKRRRAVGTTIYRQEGMPIYSFVPQGVISFYAEYRPFRSVERGLLGEKSLIDLSATLPKCRLEAQFLPNKFAGNRFSSASFDLICTGRIPLSMVGFVDANVALGIKCGTTHDFDLFMPEANGSFFLGDGLFQLLKAGEYVADKRLAFAFSWHAPGLLLNRIPLLNRLRLTEVLSLSGFWGDCSSQKPLSGPTTPYPDPAQRSLNGMPLSYPYEQSMLGSPTPPYPDPAQLMHFGRISGDAVRMNSHCYLEMGAGVENIFQLFSLRFVMQLTPSPGRDKPKMGIRLGFNY